MPWPTRKPPVQLLAEPPERVLVLVDDGHVPARALQLERDGRADPAAADHDCLHSARQAYSATAQVAASSSSSTDCGNATISTSHGALRST